MKIRHEINLTVRGEETDAAPPAEVYYDLSKYSGSLSVYFEVHAYTGSSGTVNLVGSDSTSHCQITVSSTGGYDLYRSAVSTALTADSYKITISSATVRCARIIIIQDTSTDPITAMEHQIEIGCYEAQYFGSEAAQTYPKYWYYDSSHWDGTCSWYAEVVWNLENNKYSTTIKLQEDDGSWSWSDKVTIVNAGTSETVTRTRVSFTPTTGRHYRLVRSCTGDKSSRGANIYLAKIIIQQTDATAITKWESQHLLLNSVKSTTGTGYANTIWNTTSEWDGVDMEVYHQLECSSSSSDADLYEDAADTPSKITGSDTTGTANMVRSSDIEANMPTSTDELDTYVNTA